MFSEGPNSSDRVLGAKPIEMCFLRAPSSDRVLGAKPVSNLGSVIILILISLLVVFSGLVVQETTIGNANGDLATMFVSPLKLMEWLRNMLANRLAASGYYWPVHFRGTPTPPPPPCIAPCTG